MKIHGEDNQNLGRTLPLNEDRMTRAQFYEYLKNSARLDPENFKLGNVVIEGPSGPKNWAVVVGQHTMKRLDERTFMLQDELLSKAISVLSIPLIGTEVTKYPVFWDDDLHEAVPYNEKNGKPCKATAVKLEGENMVLVFETGGDYIRLVTLWTGKVSRFVTYDSAIVFVSKDGCISFEEPEKETE